MTNREFQKRVRACERKLFGIAYLLLRTDADREDAVQEALFKAWRSIGKLRDDALFETWLTRILINECKQRMRAYKRRAETALTDTIAASEPEDPALNAAMMSLEWKYRAVLTLKYLDGFNLSEIARILNVPAGTASTRLRRARALLKHRLDGEVDS